MIDDLELWLPYVLAIPYVNVSYITMQKVELLQMK